MSGFEWQDFEWRDGERLVVFRPRALSDAPELLESEGWTHCELVTTARALGDAPDRLAEGAAAVHEVRPGPVPDAAAALLDRIGRADLVALGGGRVIDTAKALAAARGARVAAIPTTLSGAEMTAIHRLPPGHEDRPRARPALVLADPEAMTTLPEAQLRASAMNALAHGAEALYTPLANPVATLAALRGASLIAEALDEARDRRDRSALALGSILCGYAVGSAGYALHHVLSQTTVWVCGTPHAETNAAVLPRSMEAMRERAPQAIEQLAAALGTEPGRIGERIEALAGGPARLGKLGAERDRIDEVVEIASRRSELHNTPDPPAPKELGALLESAW